MTKREPAIKTGLALDYGEYIAKTTAEKLREVLVISPITEAVLGASFLTLNHLRCLNQKPITIVMYSPGGDILAGMALYDTIRAMNKYVPVDIKVTGACMSMAAVILQAARRRLATPHTSFMLHQLRGTNEGDMGTLRDRQQHMERTQKDLDAMLMERTGLTARDIARLTVRRDTYINAKEALKLNLIDKIVTD